MTQLTAFADSGAVQGGDRFVLARGGVAYQVAGTRLVTYDAGGNVSIGATGARTKLTVLPSADITSVTARQQVEIGEVSNNGNYGFRLGYSLVAGNFISVLDSIAASNGSWMNINPSGGFVGIGSAALPVTALHVVTAGGATGEIARFERTGGTEADLSIQSVNEAFLHLKTNGSTLAFLTNAALGNTTVAFDMAITNGLLLVGIASGSSHYINRAGVAEGTGILNIGNSASASVGIAAAAQPFWNGAGAALYVARNSTTGRSVNAAGTINASGADYAEYMEKADDCGPIAAGDVCGVNRDGKLTRKWSDAIGFKVKSTNPNLVGGDTWGTPDIVGERPDEPTYVAPVYDGPPEPTEEGASRKAFDKATAAHAKAVAKAQADHAKALDKHAAELAAFEARLEVERAKVDRIAYCGQVPVNFDGAFEPGDYLVPIAKGAGIGVSSTPDGDITFEQYRRRIGRVLRQLDDGRPLVDVQHG